MIQSETELRPYQLEAIDFTLSNPHEGRSIIYFEPGMGKTATGITAARRLNPNWRRLVVAPGYGMQVWPETIEAMGRTESVLVVEGTRAQRMRALAEADNYQWVVINTDMVRDQGYFQRLINLDWGTIIIDESHRFRGRNATRSQRMLELSKRAPTLIELTGTPIRNQPDDLFMQLRIAYPHDKNFSSYWRWLQKHCLLDQTPWGPKVVGVLDRDEWQEHTSQYMFTRTEEQVGLQLPEVIATQVPVQISKDLRTKYNTLKKELWLDGVPFASTAAALSTLRTLVCISPEKLSALAELIEDNAFQKVLIFCWHKDVAAVVAEHIQADFVCTGAQSATYRQDAARQFQLTDEGKRCIIVANIEAFSEANDLSLADAIIFMERDYIYGSNYQAFRRVHRTGRTLPTRVYDIYAKGTIEERIVKRVSLESVAIRDLLTEELAS